MEIAFYYAIGLYCFQSLIDIQKCHRHDCLNMLSSLVKTNDIKLTLLAVTTAKIPIGQKQTTEKIERANKHGLLSADRGGNGLCKNNIKKSPCQHTIKVLSSN